jgi:DNA gyrase/topoisomerase IV subunit A
VEADTTTTTPAQAATNDSAPAADALAAKKKLDKENLQLRRERDEFAKKLKDIEDAKLSETERLTKERDELKKEKDTWAAERRDRDARDTVIEAASDEKLAARNPRAIYRLVKDDLEFDDKGHVSNLSAVLKQAKTDYPELFGKTVGSGDGGAGSRQSGGAQDMNDWIRGVAGVR